LRPEVRASVCIAVVDDEQDLREFLGQLLEDEGYTVRSFSHPRAVTQISDDDERPRLFLIDLMLPEMTGIVLAARLQGLGFEDTPKIAMSASGTMIARAQESHLFQETLSKPFELDDFLDCVARTLAA
jgi:DNA-binding NtrC family response regulator